MHANKPFDAIDRRSTKRQTVDARTFASLDGSTVLVRDISRGGVAVFGQGITLGSRHLLEIHLQRHHLVLQIEIVACNANGTVHARFVDPPALLGSLLQDQRHE